jgi:hypothetical protein
MHTKQIEDLFDITQNFQYVMSLERHFFNTAEHLSDNYTGGQWNSEKLAQSWFFLLDTDEMFLVDGIEVSAKTFSCVVNYLVLVQVINTLHEKSLEKDPLYSELHYIWRNLINSLADVLNEEERSIYYTLID